MELRHLTTFRMVAQTLSFTQAASRLGYVQSAVTQHVKLLEEELGVPLFDRLGRSIALTDAGHRLLTYATRIEELADEARDAVTEPAEPSGVVTISAPELLCAHRLPAVLKRVYARHPLVRPVFRVNSTGALDSDQVRALTVGDVDVAFVVEENLDPPAPLTAQHLTKEHLTLVATPEHPLAGRDTVGPEDLDGVPMLLAVKGCRYRTVLERVLAERSARVDVVGEFTSGEAVKRCAEAATAVGLLAQASVATELASGSLVALAWSGPELSVHSYLVWNTARWLAPAARAVVDAAGASFGAGR
jgi:DNA-binding transcriptional LysR family regulator